MEEQINNQPLTKREKRLSKQKQEQQERLHSARLRKIKKTGAIVLATALLAAGIIFLTGKSSLRGNQNDENRDGGAPKIEINPAEYDLGDISMAAGVVKKIFEIKNTGDGDLRIDGIWTSCHCTTAVLKVGDKNSPKFGMGANPPFWSEKISAGESGYLEVFFDPAYHGPQGIGSAVRIVYLSTNDPKNKQSEILLNANIAP